MFKEKTYSFPDRILLIDTFFLTIAGIIMIYSSSAILAERIYNVNYIFLAKQSIGMIIGFISLWYFFKIDIYDLKRFSVVILITGILLLVLVLIPQIGKKVNGARRWINLYFFNIQPSELIKLCIIIYLADVLSRKQKNINVFSKGILPILFIVGLIFILLKLEPDFGRIIIISAIIFIMLLVGGVAIKYLLSLIFIASCFMFLWLRHDPLRLERVLSFFNPGEDPLGVGYHLVQSLTALKIGGFMGVGLGNSRQKFFYLPEAHNDFIFAIIGEELGFIGTCVILILFAVFIWRGFKIAFKTEDLYQGLLATGITIMISVETIINMGVVMGIMPTKGTPLPFISYGVSSLITNMAAVGILLNVSRNNI
ncbi:MAG: putative lipid II flippase FtsW [Candidatus Firestonebacteria bacterium]|nr:putative lipid II flippase FtsW [Candidatus Firestonebacteria bacterium]